jgi:stress-induced morphogen
MLASDKYIAEMGVERAAADEAMQARPPTSAEHLDSHELKCVQHYEQALSDARQASDADIGRFRTERNELRNTIHTDQVRMDLNNVVTDLGPGHAKIWTTSKSEIESSRRELELAIRRLRRFQFDHGLSAHKAQYPDSTIHHFALIAVIAVLEWVALSFFYADGSDFGLLGGVVFAFAFSIVNLGLAIGIGYMMRHVNHRSWPRKIVAITLCTLATMVFVSVSLLAAHYRDVTEQIAQERTAAATAAANASIGSLAQAGAPRDPFEASAIAVKNFRQNPWSLKQTWSWVLLLAALVFGALAAYKGYGTDDRYPGYGAVDRQHREAEKNYSEVKERRRSELDSFFSNRKKAADDAFKKITLDVRAYDRSIEQSRSLEQDFHARIVSAMSQCQTVLQRYRSVNASLRTDPPPAYFARPLRFSEQVTRPLSTVGAEETGLQEQYSKALAECRDLHDKAVAEISSKHQAALLEFDAQVRALEQWVSQQVASQNPTLSA